MRIILLIVIALSLMCSLLAIPTLQVIKTHDYIYVNRTVIVFSNQVKYLYKTNTADSTLQIRILSAAKAENYVEPIIDDSKVVRSILVEPKKSGLEVVIKTNMTYRADIMTLSEDGYKIVLDIFQKESPFTYDAGLGIANFYLSTHQFVTAKRLFSKLEADYPEKKEMNYYFAKNLVRMNRFTEALKRLDLVPATSREYEFSQILIEKFKSIQRYSEFSQDFLDSDFDIALSSPVAVKDTTLNSSKVISPSKAQVKHKKPSLLTVLATAQIPLWLALALILLLIIINAIMLEITHKQSRKATAFNNSKESASEPTLFIDEEAKRKMISKLMRDGWSNKEIAKELHISEKDTELIVKQLSVTDF